MPRNGVPRVDDRARLRFTVPADWSIETTDLLAPLTFAANQVRGEVDAETREAREARAIAEEQALWEMAANPDSGVELPAYPEDDQTAMVLAGRWENLFQEPPATDELAAGAAWLAASYGEFFELFPPGSEQHIDRSVEQYTVAGHPAANAVCRTAGADAGAEAVAGAGADAVAGAQPSTYLRVVVVRFADGRVSFLLGMAVPDAVRPAIDAILDGVEPLSALGPGPRGG